VTETKLLLLVKAKAKVQMHPGLLAVDLVVLDSSHQDTVRKEEVYPLERILLHSTMPMDSGMAQREKNM
jgi:hypothetical protein